MSQQHEEWLSVKEAASKLGVSTYNITSLIKSGVLKIRSEPTDTRKKLVNLERVRELLFPEQDDDTRP